MVQDWQPCFGISTFAVMYGVMLWHKLLVLLPSNAMLKGLILCRQSTSTGAVYTGGKMSSHTFNTSLELTNH